MEIHHQHHHDHPQHKEKLWTHYALDFFMLFLAVFCGFMAENFRECQLEKKQELVYMKNLYEDLKNDTVIYSNYAVRAKEFLAKIDTLETLMKSPEQNAQLNKIYYSARTATMQTLGLFPNQRTFEQMKDAGGLRLISSRQVADSISSYYNSLKLLAQQNQVILERQTYYMDAMSRVFDAQTMFKILKENKIPALDSCKLITDDPNEINELLVKAQYFYGSRKIQMNYGIARSHSAQNLLALIKNEYHFE